MASKRKFAFLADWNMPEEIKQYLRGLRRVTLVEFVDAGLPQNADDDDVVEIATKRGAMVLTGDKRFTETSIPLCRHEGIVKFETSKPATRLKCLKGFMRMEERHRAWKGVTHIYEDCVVLHCHNRDTVTARYPSR